MWLTPEPLTAEQMTAELLAAEKLSMGDGDWRRAVETESMRLDPTGSVPNVERV